MVNKSLHHSYGEDHPQYWFVKMPGGHVYHREDGPAMILYSGYHEWWLYGQVFSFKDYCKELNLSEDEIIVLKLKYGS